MRAPVIAVVGPGADVTDELLDAAQAVGEALAAAGATVVCGGLGGVMEAVARGARSRGGVVLGILPGDDPHGGNEHLTAVVATGMGEARNLVLVRSADAVITLGGGYGTLSEVAFALKIGRPVIVYRSWELALDGRADTSMTVVRTPAEAVAAALGAAHRHT